MNTEEELKRRDFILNGNTFKVIFTIAMPLVFYNSLNQIFQLIDTIIAANMSSKVMTTVSFIGEINTMISAIGQALAVGGGITISRYFGKGDMKEVSERISTLFFLSLAIGGIILAIVIPGAYPILKLFKMPDEYIKDGTTYFILVMIGLLSSFINCIYLAIEKSRGNTKQIMWYNMVVLLLKTSMNIIFIKVLHGSMFMLPISTIAAQGFLTTMAVKNLTSKKNPFRLSVKSCRFQKYVILPLMNLSLPVFFEKFIFAFGKVLVNTMCTKASPTAVGALGVSNRVGGLSTNPPQGFQEAESSLVSQNLGAGNTKRALEIFYKTFLINFIFSVITFTLTGIYQKPIINIFAKGDAAFALEVNQIYGLERLDAILVTMNASVMGLLYGFGKTKISMILNSIRLFVFRIPVMFLAMHLNLGVRGIGIAMLTSNGLTGIVSVIVAAFLIRKIKKAEKTQDNSNLYHLSDKELPDTHNN